MDNYFDEKKRSGLIFTEHNIDETRPYNSMILNIRGLKTVEMPGVVSYWSRLSGRYRTAKEQARFLKTGLVDSNLGRLHQ